MSIEQPHAPPEFLVLHGCSSTIVLEHNVGEAPLWRYWGPRLHACSVPPAPLRAQRMLPSFTLDVDQPLSIAPTFGVGWFGQSALLAQRSGRDFAQAFTHCEVQWLRPQTALRLGLVDPQAAVRLDVDIHLDAESDVLVLSSRLQNLGDGTLDVAWLAAATLALPSHCDTVRSYAGQHMHEFMLQTDVLSRSLWRRENRRGRTSHDCFPGAVVTVPGATQDAGLVYGAHLAWSGNHQQTIEWLPDGMYQWQLGEWLAPGEVRLAPGESLRTPDVVASCSSAGLNGLAHNFHTELRRRLQWPGGVRRPRPVHLNTWEALYFNVEPVNVNALAKAAADIGIERFVMDDGWFHGRHNDRAGLGDWWPDENKFPAGLGALIAHVNDLGMEFGLWVEPEMVNPDSDLYRNHPDWALQLQGRPLLTARNQLVLDIARPEVTHYLFDRLCALLDAHPIRYLKWDHNRDLTCAGLHDGRPGYRAQVQAFYTLLERLRKAHPLVEIESCSGGGGRIDFGVLRYTHRVWTSDCIDALSRIDIQRGMLQFFPPEIMGAHVGTAPAHTTGRTQNVAFRAAVAMSGHFGVELDVRKLDLTQRTELAAWIELYKQWRERCHRGRTWLGEAGDGLSWQAHGDENANELLLLVYRRAPSDHRYPPSVRLPMLDPAARYQVLEIVPRGTLRGTGRHASAPFFDRLGETPVRPPRAQSSAVAKVDAARPASTLQPPDAMEIDATWLIHAGLAMPRGHAETVCIMHLARCAPAIPAPQRGQEHAGI